MDCIPSQRTFTCIQCQQVRYNISFRLVLLSDAFHSLKDTKQKSHVRRNRNLSHSLWAQEGEFYQARFLLAFFLLLSLPVCHLLVFKW